MDTVGSGIFDEDLCQLSELDLPSRDPIDGFNLNDADDSIWVKGEDYKFPDFILQKLQESTLLAITYMVVPIP